MIDLGTVRPGETVYIPVNTFDSNDPSASVTATDWANTDCHVHKDGGLTQRASSVGETLTINFDSVTGNHLLAIDLADNTTAGFYEAGSVYHVRIEGVTVDGGTINAWIGTFRIGYPGAILDTSIATLASQTSFTLEDGSADDDAYIGSIVVVHDVASAVQVAYGYVSDYTGATKTVTLASDPGIFTMAVGDNISIMPPVKATVDQALAAIHLDEWIANAATTSNVAQNSLLSLLTDNAATADFNNNFDNTAQSLKALRVRGDAAWTTGGGGSLTQSIQYNMIGILQGSGAVDIANTKSYRGGLAVTNSLDDLPTSATEISPGTYAIDRAAQGGTSWTSVVADTAMSEVDGLVYFDEVFDDATYDAGDVIRVTLKSVSVTADSNTYEIFDSTGVYFYVNAIAVRPEVDLASIGGVTDNIAKMNSFFGLLTSGGQLQATTVSSDTFTAVKFADNFLTAAKVNSDVTTELQTGLATAAALATVDANLDAVLVDTGTTLPASLAAIETDTQDIQSRLPAALNNGVMPADVQRINDVALVGDGSGTPFTV